jgi:hypothetical protein
MEIDYESNSFSNYSYPDISQIEAYNQYHNDNIINLASAAYYHAFKDETNSYEAYFFDLEETSTITVSYTFNWSDPDVEYVDIQGAYVQLATRNQTYNNPINNVYPLQYVPYQEDPVYHGSFEVELEPGYYGLYTSLPNSTNGKARSVVAGITIKPNDIVLPDGFFDKSYGGGIRVKSIKQKSKDEVVEQYKKYEYNGGTLMSPLQFYFSWTYVNAPTSNGKTYVTKSSSGYRALSHSALGGLVGYESVTAHMEQPGSVNEQYPNGSIQYTYHVEPPMTKPGNPEIPYLRNGKIESEMYFDKNGNPVLNKTYEYEEYEDHRYFGFKPSLDRRAGRVDIYPLISSRINLTNVSETQFTDEGQIDKGTELIYDYKNQLKSKITSLNNKKILELYKYPYDIIIIPECENKRLLRQEQNIQKERTCFDAMKIYEVDYFECKNIKGTAYGACEQEFEALLEDYLNCKEKDFTITLVGPIPTAIVDNACNIKYIRQYNKSAECGYLWTDYLFDCSPTLEEYYGVCLNESGLMSELEINTEYESCISNQKDLFEPELAIYREMEEVNFITPVIEKQTWKIDNNENNSLISSDITIYDDFSTESSIKVFKPSKTYTMEFPNSEPISDATFNGLSMVENNSNGTYNLHFDSNYKLNANYNYNEKGNLLQYKKENDAPVSYIWGYNNTYPIAKVVNAEANEIAYTSFEDSDFSSISYSATEVESGDAA